MWPVGFNQAYGYATAGGTDTANLYDGAGNDTFVGRHNYGMLRANDNSFFNFTTGFDSVNAYATGGGRDEAILYDGATNDRLVAGTDGAHAQPHQRVLQLCRWL